MLSCLSGIFRDKTVGMVVHPQLTLGDMAEERGLNPVVEHKVYKIPYKCIVRIGRDTILVDINEKECLK